MGHKDFSHDTDARRFSAAAREAAARAGHAVHYAGHHRHNEALVAARFRLDNGLGVVLMPDARAPVFAYQTWFRTGSKHEDPERTGMAHLLEHLMFKGSRRHPTGELDREMEQRGTQTNAATWVDWTHYTETLAARGDNLETVVDFEVDRMTGLLFEAESFASELEVVKNERRMAVDDSLMGGLNELLYATAYQVHPYRWPTIGAMQHLERARMDEVERFYRQRYAPNNATLVVVGDVEPAATLGLLAARYGPLQAQPAPAAALPAEPRQEAPRLAVLERPVVVPQMLVAFHAPPERHADHALLEMLGEVLVAGDNARLYHRLVTEEALAADVSGSPMPFADPSLFEIAVTVRPEADWRRVLDVLQDELDRLARGLSAHEIAKAQNGLELGFLESLKDVEGAAEALGHHETNHGDFALAFEGPRRWAAATESELVRVATEVFRAGNRTAVVAPLGSEAS